MPFPPRLAIVGALVAGGAIAAGFFIWPSGSHTTSCAKLPSAALSANAERTLNAYSTRILHSVDVSGDGRRAESWFDPTTGRMRTLLFDATGRIVEEEARTWAGRDETTLLVDLLRHTRASNTDRAPAAYASTDNDPAAVSLRLRQAIAGGAARVAGRTTIDGAAALHLEVQLDPTVTAQGLGLPPAMVTPLLFSSPSATQIDVWVDPATYLVLRVSSKQIIGSSISDRTWLARTSQTATATNVVAPQAFPQVTDATIPGVSPSPPCGQL